MATPVDFATLFSQMAQLIIWIVIISLIPTIIRSITEAIAIWRR